MHPCGRAATEGGISRSVIRRTSGGKLPPPRNPQQSTEHFAIINSTQPARPPFLCSLHRQEYHADAPPIECEICHWFPIDSTCLFGYLVLVDRDRGVCFRVAASLLSGRWQLLAPTGLVSGPQSNRDHTRWTSGRRSHRPGRGRVTAHGPGSRIGSRLQCDRRRNGLWIVRRQRQPTALGPDPCAEHLDHPHRMCGTNDR